MAKIDLPKQSGKRSKVREKSVKSQGILKTILSGNPAYGPIYQSSWHRRQSRWGFLAGCRLLTKTLFFAVSLLQHGLCFATDMSPG